MQINKFFACSLVTACAVLSACTSDNIEIPKSELYAREFVKQFGVVDPNHDWNNATQGSVTVVTSSPTHVEVLADIRGERYIFADYHNVNGKETINFTIPKGVSELIVTLDGQQFKTQIGGTVDGRNRSRIVSDPTSEGNTGVTAELVTDQNLWMVVPMLNATVFRRKMPESCYNALNDGVHNDFTFKFTEHDIIIRPLYWQTNQTLELGLFYIGDDGKAVHFPIYKMEKGTKGQNMDNQVLCWAPTETKSITIENFMENKDFMSCLNKNGITIIDRTDISGRPYKYIDVYSLDNFLGITTAKDDHNMTFACRDYLTSIGIENNPANAVDKRFNYVYRWEMVGDPLKVPNEWNNPVEVYDASFINDKKRTPRKDLKITYTFYNFDYSKADGWSGSDDMITGITMDDDNYPALISKGIKVHIDDISKYYGAYVNRGDKNLYSVSSLNEKTRWIPGKDAERTDVYWDYQSGNTLYRYPDNAFVKDEAHKAFRAVTWIGEKYAWRYLSFEDGLISETEYNRNACDFDMQDFVFIIDNANPQYGDPTEIITDDPTPPTPTPKKYEWIIAAEDLGGSYDWDFNDLVASISLLSTNTPATTAEGGDGSTDPYVAVEITPLASGGTMPIYLMYTGDLYETGSTTATNGNFIIGKEFHTWFGVPTTKPANVDKGSENSPKTATSVTINAPKSFTLSKNDKYNANGSQNNMGGFWVLVVDKDEEYNPAIADGAQYTKVEDSKIYNKQNITTIGSPNDDKANVAPQMICVGEEWYWPLENHNITLAYPHDNDENPTTGFKGWLTNPTIDDTWYTTGTKVEEHLFMRKKD